MLSRLKLAVPLTAGQVVAAALVEGASADAALLDAAWEEARAEGRNVAPELERPEGRRQAASPERLARAAD